MCRRMPLYTLFIKFLKLHIGWVGNTEDMFSNYPDEAPINSSEQPQVINIRQAHNQYYSVPEKLFQLKANGEERWKMLQKRKKETGASSQFFAWSLPRPLEKLGENLPPPPLLGK